MKHRFAKVVGILVAGIVGSATFMAGSAAAATPTTVLVSRDTGAAGTVGTSAGEPYTSADGRYVTFQSTDNFGGLNPSAGVPPLPVQQIWRRDLTTNTTVLVSRADGASGAAGNPVAGGAPMGGASISADGRYVAFDSASTNLVPLETIPATNCVPATSTIQNVYVRDLVAGTTRLVSHVPGSATAGANNTSEDPRISPDGLTVAYTSTATDLLTVDPGLTCGTGQLFAERTLVNVLVSRADGVTGAVPNADSESSPGFNTTGSKIAFVSSGTNLVSGPAPPTGEIYVRDLVAGTTTLVSRADGASGASAIGAAGDVCGHPGMSADGSAVVFSCAATNLGVPSGAEQVYVRNLSNNSTIIASRADGPTGAPASADSSAPVISGDGLAVVFESTAPELGTGGQNQVIERFLLNGTTVLLSRASGDTGAVGSAQSSDIATNSDGSVTAFESVATNLTADTLPADSTNVYVRTVTPPKPLAAATASPFIPTIGRVGVGPAPVPGGAWLAVAALLLAATLVGTASARRRLER